MLTPSVLHRKRDIFRNCTNNFHSISGAVADPFTGSGAYASTPMEVDSIEDASEYFPQKTYLQFSQVFHQNEHQKIVFEF